MRWGVGWNTRPSFRRVRVSRLPKRIVPAVKRLIELDLVFILERKHGSEV